jgi:hypothetical protein
VGQTYIFCDGAYNQGSLIRSLPFHQRLRAKTIAEVMGALPDISHGNVSKNVNIWGTLKPEKKVQAATGQHCLSTQQRDGEKMSRAACSKYQT